MGEKDIKKIIDNIKNSKYLEEEILKIEEEIFFREDIPKLSNDDKLIIKNMVSEKMSDKDISSTNDINSKKASHKIYKRKSKFMKVATITGLVIGAITIGYPIAASIIDNFYNYIPNEGSVVQSVGDVYILEKPIIQSIDSKEIKLESMIFDLGNKTITTKIIGKDIAIKDKSTIKVGNATLESEGYSRAGGGYDWTIWYEFGGEFEYNGEGNIIYTITSADGENIEFNTKLKKVESTSDYKNLGNTDVKNKIAITAISTEEENILDVNFIDKIEGNTANINSYGKIFYNDEYDTGVVLKDANGKVVKGKWINHGDRSNNFQFDTTGLVKPYTINIPSVTLGMFGVLEGEEIKLELPSKDSISVNKEIILKGKNESIVSENNKVIIKSIEKIEGNQYKINFEFPKNSQSDFKISDVDVDAYIGVFRNNPDFSGYISDFDLDTEALKYIIFEPENKYKNTVKFKLYPYNYKVEGDWNIVIK